MFIVKLLAWLKWLCVILPFCIIKDVIGFYTSRRKSIEGQVSGVGNRYLCPALFMPRENFCCVRLYYPHGTAYYHELGFGLGSCLGFGSYLG